MIDEVQSTSKKIVNSDSGPQNLLKNSFLRENSRENLKANQNSGSKNENAGV